MVFQKYLWSTYHSWIQREVLEPSGEHRDLRLIGKIDKEGD